MLTSKQCLEKCGDPRLELEMQLWRVPAELQIGKIPRRVYCNRRMIAPLEKALREIVEQDLAGLIESWDGCFSLRKKRGGDSWSLHAFGLAIDVNAETNRMGQTPTMDSRIVEIFENAGFSWGGRWAVPDGMHFQLAEL